MWSTFTQNRLGTDSCSFAQTEFSGFASPFQYQTEFMAVTVLLIILLLIVLACLFFTNYLVNVTLTSN